MMDSRIKSLWVDHRFFIERALESLSETILWRNVKGWLVLWSQDKDGAFSLFPWENTLVLTSYGLSASRRFAEEAIGNIFNIFKVNLIFLLFKVTATNIELDLRIVTSFKVFGCLV